MLLYHTTLHTIVSNSTETTFVWALAGTKLVSFANSMESGTKGARDARLALEADKPSTLERFSAAILGVSVSLLLHAVCQSLNLIIDLLRHST